jgi:hypothetical protein
MIERRSVLITILGLTAGVALSVWLYHRFKIVGFFIFIPVFSIGGPLFRNIWRGKEKAQGEIEHHDYTVEDDKPSPSPSPKGRG